MSHPVVSVHSRPVPGLRWQWVRAAVPPAPVRRRAGVLAAALAAAATAFASGLAGGLGAAAARALVRAATQLVAGRAGGAWW